MLFIHYCCLFNAGAPPLSCGSLSRKSAEDGGVGGGRASSTPDRTETVDVHRDGRPVQLQHHRDFDPAEATEAAHAHPMASGRSIVASSPQVLFIYLFIFIFILLSFFLIFGFFVRCLIHLDLLLFVRDLLIDIFGVVFPD